MKRFLLPVFSLLIGATIWSACVKKDFDAPPDLSNFDPKLTVNMSVAGMLDSLNGLYNVTNGGDTTMITGDYIISGVVTANDKSGNFYKQIVIDDSSAAIMVLVDANNLYNDYPVGRRIYIKLKGLWLGYDGGLPVLGYTPTAQVTPSSIPTNRIAEHIIKGNIGNPVPTFEVTAEQVGYYKDSTAFAKSQYFNRLITIRNVEFVDGGAKPYTEPTASASRNITSCSNYLVVVRSSNYANFSATILPEGNGTITGIYTVYQSGATRKIPQLLIRDTADVVMKGPRCDGTNPGGQSLINENFGTTTSGDITLAGWTNWATAGGKKYQFSTAGSTGNAYAKISAFQSAQPSVISWLITPGLVVTGTKSPTLSFRTATGFSQAEVFGTYISTNYTDGTDPANATWTLLQATYPPAKASGYTSFTPSGDIDLSSYTGTVHIAFKYEGGDPGKTGTWEVDDVKVTTQP